MYFYIYLFIHVFIYVFLHLFIYFCIYVFINLFILKSLLVLHILRGVLASGQSKTGFRGERPPQWTGKDLKL